MVSCSTLKGLHFSFLQQSLRIKFFFDSAQYHTYCAESIFFILNYEYLGENKTEFENILTHWSVDQTGSNDEKTRGRKSRWTVPLNIYHFLYFKIIYIVLQH